MVWWEVGVVWDMVGVAAAVNIQRIRVHCTNITELIIRVDTFHMKTKQCQTDSKGTYCSMEGDFSSNYDVLIIPLKLFRHGHVTYIPVVLSVAMTRSAGAHRQ